MINKQQATVDGSNEPGGLQSSHGFDYAKGSCVSDEHIKDSAMEMGKVSEIEMGK
ncbi:hypothetical protein MKX01_041186, partial [Papaver californicum]